MDRVKKINMKGFTLVELLVVIVVIAVLASVSVLAYNGLTDRARLDRYVADIALLNRAILLHQATNGKFPYKAGDGDGCKAVNSNGMNPINDWIPNIAPQFIPKVPLPPTEDVYYMYCQRGDGEDYKILRLAAGNADLSTAELNNPSVKPRIDPRLTTKAWGYWSNGCATVCP